MLLLVNLAATLFMTGLIWFVQVVHYPLFASVGRDAFRAYHAAHAGRTTAIVLPVMAVELCTAVLLAIARPPGVPAAAAWGALALVLLVWASTGLLQVPRHQQLGRGFDAAAIHSLGAGNWVRTVAWSARAAMVLWMAAVATAPGVPG